MRDVRTFRATATPQTFNPEFLMLGDSLMDNYAPSANIKSANTGAYVYTPAESETRAGIVSLAVGGQKILDQKTVYEGSIYRNKAFTGIVEESGYNDVVTGDGAATALSRKQTFATALKSEHPTAKLVVPTLLPVKPGFAGFNTDRNTYNAGVTATTGVDDFCTEWTLLLSDSADNLAGWTNIGDNHPLDDGKRLMGAALRQSLQRVGLLP
jgi:hypothetical protein